MPKTQKAMKKMEKRVASNLTQKFSSVFRSVGSAFVKLFRIFDSKLTIMIVPHSQSKVLNFQTNVFALFFGLLLFIGILFSFFYFNHHSISANMQINNLTEQNRATLASLDELRDENALLGISQGENTNNSTISSSDLSSMVNSTEIAKGTTRELADIRELTSYLENSIEPIEQVGKMLKTQQNLFTEIPSINPVKNPNVHVSMPFGPNVHPLNGNWYIHKGMDFSTWRSGDPVMATASGQVVTVGFDNSFGNFVIIKHNHGIYTRYAHLSTFRVKRGQLVDQGQIIGNIGNTGISTGPHLHYEVHIGSDVVDPAKYINIK